MNTFIHTATLPESLVIDGEEHVRTDVCSAECPDCFMGLVFNGSVFVCANECSEGLAHEDVYLEYNQRAWMGDNGILFVATYENTGE